MVHSVHTGSNPGFLIHPSTSPSQWKDCHPHPIHNAHCCQGTPGPEWPKEKLPGVSSSHSWRTEVRPEPDALTLTTFQDRTPTRLLSATDSVQLPSQPPTSGGTSRRHLCCALCCSTLHCTPTCSEQALTSEWCVGPLSSSENLPQPLACWVR